jgi:hypothetical protein
VARAFRARAMHRVGGPLDLAHSTQGGHSGSFEMGNFLYGANAIALGFTPSQVLNGSHAYQAISDGGYFQYVEGIYNYMNNTGDNPGDQMEVLRGIRYYQEVFQFSPHNNSSMSCVDSATQSGGGSTNPGGGGGPGTQPGGGGGSPSGPNNPGGGYIAPSGEEWCFVDSRDTVQYCWIEN